MDSDHIDKRFPNFIYNRSFKQHIWTHNPHPTKNKQKQNTNKQ